MENKGTCVLSVVLNTAGILLLVAAAFDMLPLADNQAIFFAIACFVIGAAAKKMIKSGAGSCCK